MRIALFATCLADAMFPRAAQATVVLLERLGHEVVFPAGQTCCGQMHVNTGYRREALPLVRHHVEVFERALADGADAVVAPSGSCVGSVRHQHAGLALDAGDEALAGRAEEVAAPDVRALRAARRRARRHRRRRPLPAPRDLPPDLPLAADAARRRQAAAAAAGGARHRPRRAARRRPVLRVRRHVRAEERRHLDGDAGRQAGRGRDDRRRGRDRRRLLVPDAHRRRPVPRRRAGGPGRSTSPRSSRARAGRRRCEHLPRHAASASRTRPSAARCAASTRSRRRPHGAGERPAAPQPRPRHRARSAPSGPRSSARCPTGRSCATPAPRSRTTSWPACPSCWSSSRRRSPPAAARCTGPATPTRPTGSSPTSSAPPGADQVVKVKSMATQEIGLNEALADAGHRRGRDRPRRAHRAARRRQAVAHPGAGDPPQPGRDPRRSSSSTCPAWTPPSPTSRGCWRWPRAPTCAARSSPPGWRSAAPTSPSPRPARWPWSSPRATAGCASPCRRR